MATKKDTVSKKKAAPAPKADLQAQRELQTPVREAQPLREAQPVRAGQGEPALESKGSSRGTTSHRSSDEIARRAYQLWVQRGGSHGGDQQDWHAAEQELDGSRH